MKLWFEGWNVNALDALPLLSNTTPAGHRRADKRDN
jgi:hypothetical protein